MPLPTCPICDKPVQPEHHPFCSRGCRDRDLLQWLTEGYRVPATPGDDEEDGVDSPDSRY
jgi:hypothetical protein